MSIFSGFGTRQQETAYNSLIESTINLLQSRVVSNIKKSQLDENSFKMQLLKNYDSLIKLEAHKYLQPMFSESIKEIVVSVIKTQMSTTKGSFVFKERNMLADMKKTSLSLKLPENKTERSTTPILPSVKSQIKIRNLTPIRGKHSEKGFLYARLATDR